MQCPQCNHENKSSAKFCLNCGVTLQLACPHCGAANPIARKFCNGCGKAMGALETTPEEPPINDLIDQFIAETPIRHLQPRQPGAGAAAPIPSATVQDISRDVAAAQPDQDDIDRILAAAYIAPATTPAIPAAQAAEAEAGDAAGDAAAEAAPASPVEPAPAVLSTYAAYAVLAAQTAQAARPDDEPPASLASAAEPAPVLETLPVPVPDPVPEPLPVPPLPTSFEPAAPLPTAAEAIAPDGVPSAPVASPAALPAAGTRVASPQPDDVAASLPTPTAKVPNTAGTAGEQQKPQFNTGVLIGAIVLLFVVIAGAAYWFYARKPAEPALPPVASAPAVTITAAPAATEVPEPTQPATPAPTEVPVTEPSATVAPTLAAKVKPTAKPKVKATPVPTVRPSQAHAATPDR
ncbi:zinc ribbon domain-containing protein, partial [Andreprevotia sp. IGB-42]|uniref:zinc ribbon domain-containing protein n=1 Tax=Andreprevotia sp. IGB-42 TaxID=2497473 RepID=UPI0015808DCA